MRKNLKTIFGSNNSNKQKHIINVQDSPQMNDLRNKFKQIFGTPTAVPTLIETTLAPTSEFDLPIAMIIVSMSVFISGIMLVYFYLLRQDQKKYDSDTFVFTVDEDKNNYSKKIKFLDE